MKNCRACGVDKTLDCFSAERQSPDGKQRFCKACQAIRARLWREVNRESIKTYNKTKYSPEYHKSRYRNQRDRLLELCAENRRKNPEKRKAVVRSYKRKNAGKVLADTRFRQTLQMKATPVWADRKAIETIYIEANRLSRETGVPHHVDHIYPLRGKTCCGLHVENNLQIVTAAENMAKGNRMPVEVMC